jgi:hypothetical protein
MQEDIALNVQMLFAVLLTRKICQADQNETMKSS